MGPPWKLGHLGGILRRGSPFANRFGRRRAAAEVPAGASFSRNPDGVFPLDSESAISTISERESHYLVSGHGIRNFGRNAVVRDPIGDRLDPSVSPSFVSGARVKHSSQGSRESRPVSLAPTCRHGSTVTGLCALGARHGSGAMMRSSGSARDVCAQACFARACSARVAFVRAREGAASIVDHREVHG